MIFEALLSVEAFESSFVPLAVFKPPVLRVWGD